MAPGDTSKPVTSVSMQLQFPPAPEPPEKPFDLFDENDNPNNLPKPVGVPPGPEGSGANASEN